MRSGAAPLAGRGDYMDGLDELADINTCDVDAKKWIDLQDKWNDALPALNDGPDLFVFLSELSDITSLVEQKVLTLSVPGVLTAGSTAHLTNAFVLKPLVSDIKSLIRRFATLRKRARRIVDYQRKLLSSGKISVQDARQTLSTDVKITIHQCLGTSPYNPTKLCPNGACVKTTRMSTVTMSCGGLFTYELPIYMHTLRNTRLSYIDLLDLDLDADAIWELVPFSFVVDWFVNTGRILAWIKRHSGNELRVNIHDFYWIARQNVRVERTIANCRMAKTMSVERNYVLREVGQEALTARVPAFKLPSFYQWTYGLALSWLMLSH
jgi:hypothetical protein